MIIIRSGTLSDSIHDRLSDWGLGAILLLFGIILLSPYNTFSTSRVYDMMAGIAPEDVWGLVCLLIGGGRLAVLLINGLWRRSPHLRAAAAVLSCCIWTLVALSLLDAGTFSTGLAAYPVFVCMDLFSAYRAAVDARVSDDEAAGNAGA